MKDLTKSPVRALRPASYDSISADSVQMDEFLRRARVADAKPAAPATPAGQIPLEVTEAFIRFVSLLNATTDGDNELELVVRCRSTRQVAGVVPVTEDTAVGLLSAMSGTATITTEPAPVHQRTEDTAPVTPLRLVRPLRLVTAGGAS